MKRKHRGKRNKNKWGLVLKCLAVFGGVLSLHGLYAYAHKNDWWLAGEVITGEVKQGDLFFVIPMPPILNDIVSWMSYEGVQSWFVPIVILGVCIFVWVYSRRINRRRKWQKRFQ